MKIKNISDELVRVASYGIAPGRIADIPDNHWRSWAKEYAGRAVFLQSRDSQGQADEKACC